MINKHAPVRSLDEWMELITECRRSGLNDAAWCQQKGISVSSFYNAATRLRKRACTIPEPVGKATCLDLTTAQQDVVRVDIKPEVISSEPIRQIDTSPHIDNSHTIELEMDDVSIKISNSADPYLLQQIFRMLRPGHC